MGRWNLAVSTLIAVILAAGHSLALGMGQLRPERRFALALLEVLSLYFVAVILPAVAIQASVAAGSRPASRAVDFRQGLSTLAALTWALVVALLVVDAFFLLRAHSPDRAAMRAWAAVVAITALVAPLFVKPRSRAAVLGLILFGVIFALFGYTAL